MKILVTSSTGLTGKAVVSHLARHGAYVRAMVHSPQKATEMTALGADEVVAGSIESVDDLRRAMTGMDAVFYICPNAHPREDEIGIMAAGIASRLGVKRFIYQSVHNSIEPGLIHHRRKLRVEQRLLESDLLYTILRPAAFMQNVLPALSRIRDEHIFSQRFFVNEDAVNRINLINAQDYGEICAEVSVNDEYVYAQLDLCGPRNLSAGDMLTVFKEATGHEVTLDYITDADFIRGCESRKMSRDSVEVLLAMFMSYNKYGFLGNSRESAALLGREPHDFKTFVIEALKDY